MIFIGQNYENYISQEVFRVSALANKNIGQPVKFEFQINNN